MIQKVQIDQQGERAVIDVFTEDALHSLDEAALVSWAELLGLTDMIDVIEAILTVRTGGGLPTDPATGEHPLTASYTVLEHREKARNAEARMALAEGRQNDPRSPKLRAAMAARRAVMEPTGAAGDSDSLIEKVRGSARDALNTKCPRNPCSTGRIKPITCEAEPQADGDGLLAAADREVIRAALAGRAEHVEAMRGRWLHELTGEDDDPLAEPDPEEMAAPEPDPTMLDGLVARHGGSA